MSFHGYEAMQPDQHAEISRGLQPARMIAGAGFAMMAWELAKARCNPNALVITTRAGVMLHGPDCNRASREFYRILDRAWDAWTIERRCMMSGLGDPRRARL